MKSFVLLALIISTQAQAKDPNFLTADDLPKTTYQIYSESEKPPAPTFPDHYGEAEALKANYGEDVCHSKVGQQLTPWVREISDNGFPGPFARYTFTVSATFACETPTLSIVLPAETSSELFKILPIVAKGQRQQKRARVLCYHTLEEVCNGSVLMDYNEYQICEISDLDDPSQNTSIKDANYANGAQTNQGATSLTALLPVYRDTRRDDTPGPNCAPPILGKLKGIEREAATITCSKQLNSAIQCLAEGILKMSGPSPSE